MRNMYCKSYQRHARILSYKLKRTCKKLLKTVAFFAGTNIIKLTEPNTPLNDADHVGSFNFKENIVGENLNSIGLL